MQKSYYLLENYIGEAIPSQAMIQKARSSPTVLQKLQVVRNQISKLWKNLEYTFDPAKRAQMADEINKLKEVESKAKIMLRIRSAPGQNAITKSSAFGRAYGGV